MHRKIMQLAAFLLIFTLISPILPAQAAGDGSDMLRVGLTHASGALTAANLENNRRRRAIASMSRKMTLLFRKWHFSWFRPLLFLAFISY